MLVLQILKQRKQDMNDAVILDCHKPHRYGSPVGWKALWVHFDGLSADAYYRLILRQAAPCQPSPPAVRQALEALYGMFSRGETLSEPQMALHLTAALTARTYAMSIVMFSYVFAIAIGQGAAISIGHLIGEDRDNAAFSVEKYSIKLAMLISVCISVLTALVGTDIFKLLSHNPDVIAMGATVLYIDVLLEIGRAVNITSVNSLNAAGDVMYPFVTGVIVMWGVATLLAYVLGIWWGWGLNGIWLAMALDENIRAVVFERRWKSRKWENKSFARRSA